MKTATRFSVFLLVLVFAPIAADKKAKAVTTLPVETPPSASPSNFESAQVLLSDIPSDAPSDMPSDAPSDTPSDVPSAVPTCRKGKGGKSSRGNSKSKEDKISKGQDSKSSKGQDSKSSKSNTSKKSSKRIRALQGKASGKSEKSSVYDECSDSVDGDQLQNYANTYSGALQKTVATAGAIAALVLL